MTASIYLQNKVSRDKTMCMAKCCARNAKFRSGGRIRKSNINMYLNHGLNLIPSVTSLATHCPPSHPPWCEKEGRKKREPGSKVFLSYVFIWLVIN